MMGIKQADGTRRTKAATARGRTVWTGLSDAQAGASAQAHGYNRLTRQKRKGFWRYFVSNLNDPVIRILLAALALNLLLMFEKSDWVETVGIAVSVLLATVISTVSEVGSEAAFARLQEQSARATCRVLRSGAVRSLSWEQVVVGDVVLLGAGENVPADGYLVEGELTVDQAAMTGESREIRKRAGNPALGEPNDGASLFRGCAVLSGEGKLLVRAVGDATVLGGISREVQSETRDSPMKVRLARLAGQISVLGYVAAVLVAAAFLFNAFVIDSGFRWEVIRMKLTDLPYLWQTLLHGLMLGLTVIVVAVPEGLPMMIAVVLSANTRRMVRDRVLVRKPAGIEAAGSMDLLFTDKTGTLTDGKLSVGALLTGEGTVYPDSASLMRAGRERGAWYLASAYANTGAVKGEKEGQTLAVGGNSTDRALLSDVLDQSEPRVQVLWRIPFDSARKYSAAAVERADGRRALLIKGAPERLLPYLTGTCSGDGHVAALSRPRLEQQLSRWAAAGERVLLLAIGDASVSQGEVQAGRFGALTLLCALTLSDRIRPEARQAVEALQSAGVQVVMITGDGRDTATQIAASCGIVRGPDDVVLTGEQLSALSDYQLKELLPRLSVVARALPADKSRLVRVAQEQNRVVGMTGDGINDAPALRRSDIGFAMGSGAAVAKDAGDILILDDRLASIVRAVLYGRNIFKTIRKFITLQLTMNFCAVAVSMIGPFIGVDAPVTVVQMLWINLIMDTLGGLAFAGEAALPSYLKERPKRRDEPILCGYMISEIVFLGGYTVALCLLFLKHPAIRSLFRVTEGNLCHLTAFFALFIFASVFNCFNARSERLRPCVGLLQNRGFMIIMVVILAVQLAFVYLGGSVLRTMPLTARELLLTALLALTVIPAEKLRKLGRRLLGKTGKY